MMICLTASAEGLLAEVDPRFGRCGFFTFVDMETMAHRSLPNPGASASGGAGPQAAQFVADQGATVVITGQVGPNALATLNALAIKVYETTRGTVDDALQSFKKGSLKEVLDERIRF
jgi:predicted Fe-Mo cluster-binding NifX family protein